MIAKPYREYLTDLKAHEIKNRDECPKENTLWHIHNSAASAYDLAIDTLDTVVKSQLEALKPTRPQQLDNGLLCLGMTTAINETLEVLGLNKEERENKK